MTHLDVDLTDLAEAEAFLDRRYSLTFDPLDRGQDFRLRFSADTLGTVALTRSSYDAHCSMRAVDPLATTGITVMRRGDLGVRIGDQENRWGAGDVFVGVGAGSLWEATVRDCDLETVTIDPATFGAVARSADGSPAALTGYSPVSAKAAEQWIRAVTYADNLAACPDVSELVAVSTARMLAATALATFPNNALLDPTIEDRHDAHPATVRRAVAFIESHPERAMSVADIAEAACVTPRAVQLAFRRHLDTTPLAYLRKVRLARAHAELQAADPTTATVTTIANSWGFDNPGRFAGYYVRTYGSRPRTTLREDGPGSSRSRALEP